MPVDLPSTHKRRWLGPLVAVAALGACALLAEAGLRLFWNNPYRNEPSDYVQYMRLNHPGRDLPVDRSLVYPEDPTALFRTDERGYILPSNQHEDPQLTIVFLGGSTTECATVSEPVRFPALVSERLGNRGLRVNTLNAGRSGNTAHDSVNLLLNYVVDDAPDIAVMMNATNDVGVLWKGQGYAWRTVGELTPTSFYRWGLMKASARSSLAALARSAFTLYAPSQEDFDHLLDGPEMGAVDPAPFEARVRAFVALSRALGIVPVLMTQPSTRLVTRYTPKWTDARNHQRFNEIIRRVALEEDVVLIDLVQHLVDEIPGWDEPMNVFFDGVHVTDRGSGVYATHIANVLAAKVIPPLLERSRSAATD